MSLSEPIEPTAEAWAVPPQLAALTLFKIVGVVVSSALFAALSVRFVLVAVSSSLLTLALAALPALLLGYLAADLLSGTAHWFCDTFFEEDTPVVGPIVIQPFRDHHTHPQRITRYRFIEQDTTNFFLMLPLLAIALWRGIPQPGDRWTLFWCCCLLGLAAGSFCTNLFHKWAHMRHRPRLVRGLQRAGLILGPERHQRHHGDYSRGFCVTSGWMNPLLDSIRFFPRVERAVRFFQR